MGARTSASPRHALAWLLARAGFAAILLALLASRVDWHELLSAFARTRPGWVVAGAAVVILARLLAAYRWHLLLRDRVKVGLASVVRMTFVSDFLTAFLPSGVGADTTRAWLVARAAPQRMAGVSSVLADRILGSWVLLLLGGVTVMVAPVPLQHRLLLAAAISVLLLVSAVFVILVLRLRHGARRALARLPWIGLRTADLAERLLMSLDRYRKAPGLVARVVVLTLVLNGLRILTTYAFGLAVGSPASLVVHAAFVPVIFALAQIPVTIADGLGIREVSYVYLYDLAGVPAGTTLAMALLMRLIGYLMILPGAALLVHGDGGARRATSRRSRFSPAPGPDTAAPEGGRDDRPPDGGVPGSRRRITRVLVDAHAHLHRGFRPGAVLDAAYANVWMAAGPGRGGVRGMLLLTELAGEDRFGELARGARGRAGRLDTGEWAFHPTDEDCSLTAVRGSRRIVLVAGRQVATSDGLEVLVFGTRWTFEDGRPLRAVLERVRELGLLHAVPWGAGKWFFRRGRLVSEILESAPGPLFCLGDEGGRPAFWRRVRHFEEARRRGVRVLRGTDALPFPDEESRPGSFGFGLDLPFDPARPMASLREALADPGVPLHDYGRLERPLPFVVHQWGMQRRKRARTRSASEPSRESAAGPLGPEPAVAPIPPGGRSSGDGVPDGAAPLVRS